MMLNRFTAALRVALAATLLAAAYPALAAKESLRPEVGKPLQEAQASLQAKNFKEALAKIDAAEGVGKLTPYESYIVNRMRGAAAAGAGDLSTATKAFEAALASGQVPKEEQVMLLETVVKASYGAKNYPKTVEYIQKYKAAGGNKPDVLGLSTQVLYLSGRYAEAGKELSAQIVEMEKAGKTPSETQLGLLANIALKQNDNNGYLAALERMAAYYPKKNYWLDLILRTAGKPGFSDRLLLDVYRLREATGTLERASDYMEATQLAVSVNPAEAQKFIDAGYKAQLLGVGPDAERHTRLKTLVAKKVQEDQATLSQADKQADAAPSGDPLVNTGFNYVALGQYDKGIAMMQKGIQKGQLKRPDEAKLHLGYAYLLAGNKAEAVKTFRTVQGADGSKDLARLWVIQSRSMK